LTGSLTRSTAAANLTTEGTADWVHWGDGALNRKSGVIAQLSTYSVVGSGAVNTYGNDPRGISWSDGAPTATVTADTKGVYIAGTGKGFSFTAPASTTTQVLTVHVGGYNSGGTLTASLGDGSAPNFVNTTATAAGQYDANYTLTYTAGSTTTLTVKWVMSSGTGNVTIDAAALSSTIAAQPVAATPSFSPAPGAYTGTQPVTLSDATSGALIYYTNNGTTPTINSAQYVSGTPIPVSVSETIEAIAVASGYTTSAVASGSYTISASVTGPVSVGLSTLDNIFGLGTVGTAVSNGGIDTLGDDYAATLLGTSITWSGATFTVGGANVADMVSSATIALPPGSYTTLKMLATGVDGNQHGQNFIVTYSDGTTTNITQSLSDWHTPENFNGESIVTSMPYRILANGTADNRTFYLYGYSFALNSAKTVKSLTLPSNRDVVVLAIDLVP
jgi:hypothetical protein